MNNFTSSQPYKIFKIILLFIIIISIVALIFNLNYQESDYSYGGSWSSLVLEFPSKTTDWKEWQGKTYCLIEDKWHLCEPQLVNTNAERDK